MSLTTRDPEVNPTPLLRWGASGLVPEGTDGGESFHGFSEVGEQRELRRVIQLLQVPVTGDSGWVVRGAVCTQPRQGCSYGRQAGQPRLFQPQSLTC